MNDLKEKFEILKNQWYDKRNNFSSSLRDVCDIPEYFKIISLGPEIVPFIIEELKIEPDFWFIALEKLTNHKIELEENDYGRIEIISKKWIDWYEKENK